ncbi:MAG: hypothetical protein HQL90_04335 [Magnetococcales bacterium]|nr:hypothetical protein [Magnetococcales bacterium]
MEWIDVGKKLAGIGLPVLGGVLGGAPGAALAKGLAGWITGNQDDSPESIINALEDPEAQQRAREFYAKHEETVLRLHLQAEEARNREETARTVTVNETMRKEADSLNFLVNSWRAVIGYAVAFNIVIASSVVAAAYLGVIFGSSTADLLSLIPAMLGAMGVVNGAALPILGVNTYFHGKGLADPNNKEITRG